MTTIAAAMNREALAQLVSAEPAAIERVVLVRVSFEPESHFREQILRQRLTIALT